ncbi:MAG: serine hydrolase domain-containing protein [Halanaerobiales bacterium]
MSVDLQMVSELMNKEQKNGTFPGAVLAITDEKKLIYQQAFGFAQIEPQKRVMNKDTIFDLASLTKVVATTISVMHLIEYGKINLWDYLKEYFPNIPEEKEELTIYHLLTHTSGYQAIVRLWDKDMNYEQKIEYILNLPLEANIGKRVEYSDPNFILLGDLVKRVSGKNLNHYFSEYISEKLNMGKTCFNPLQNLSDSKNNFAATEYCDWRERYMIGEVHDENAFSLGGISGHAGLFSTSSDLVNFVQMILNKGTYQGKNVLSSSTIMTMTSCWTENFEQKRGLGWDLIKNYRSSGGVLFSGKAFGHTGFTGTSIWIDPVKKLGVILLSNRVHPSRDNVQIISLRPRLHNLIVNVLER